MFAKATRAMNAKKVWSLVCLVLVAMFTWTAYQDVQAHDYPLERAIGRFVPALFHLLIAAILWAQGREKNAPNPPPELTRRNGL